MSTVREAGRSAKRKTENEHIRNARLIEYGKCCAMCYRICDHIVFGVRARASVCVCEYIGDHCFPLFIVINIIYDSFKLCSLCAWRAF